MTAELAEAGGLSEAQATLVVEIAKAPNRLGGGTENFLVTREFRHIASKEEEDAILAYRYSFPGPYRSSQAPMIDVNSASLVRTPATLHSIVRPLRPIIVGAPDVASCCGMALVVSASQTTSS